MRVCGGGSEEARFSDGLPIDLSWISCDFVQGCSMTLSEKSNQLSYFKAKMSHCLFKLSMLDRGNCIANWTGKRENIMNHKAKEEI